MIRRALIGAALIVIAGGSSGAQAQTFERIDRYDVRIEIRRDDSLRITETIAYDFGARERHGIFRDVPTTLRYDDTDDRIYPLSVEAVSASPPGTPAGFATEGIEGGLTRIRIGDPDRTITGSHTYTIVYTVDAALNGFPEHDELYWNAVGHEWDVPIERVRVQVIAPGRLTDVACFAGVMGSTLPCSSARITTTGALVRQSALDPLEGITVVAALPKGVVQDPVPRLSERWSFASAFRLTPVTAAASAGLLVAVLAGLGTLMWKRGRDRRFVGSDVDQVMGNPTGKDQSVPLFEADASAPVEFAPPDGLRPGQIGTLVDEQANTLDVTATIVDLAVRGYVRIREIPKDGWFGRPDWTLMRLEHPVDDLLAYERQLLDALFRDGDEVAVSALRSTFAKRLASVERALYTDAVTRGWFLARPDKVRETWAVRGALLLVAGAVLTFVLARWTHLGLLGLPVAAGGLALILGAKRMPSRTAKGTATLRRVRGFRTVIEKAETNISRWAEQENVFTRYLPYAIVFGCTERWARAFASIGQQPDTSWYVSSHPFVYASFAHSIDGFAVTTGGTIAATPSGSGSSGFGGGGFSGGGGGGGGGGSW